MPRPLTILDAVSAAGGFETGLMNNKTAELADLRRAFLARGGQHIPTDFTALFQRGDTSQNHLLQPGDYLYFPPATAAQVQIFGNVKTQGTQAHYAHSSVTSVLTTAGGFTKRAYQRRVLIIRGSLAKPEAIPVDMAEILSGQASSTALQPGDILYVADKPWARAEQILDYALSAFVMGSVGTYANQHVLPIVTQPLFGQ